MWRKEPLATLSIQIHFNLSSQDNGMAVDHNNIILTTELCSLTFLIIRDQLG